MKRKIFSKLLMGAFLIASVSSFVSCKDYDDDINNLQKQIDAAALKAELTTLQSTLAAQIQEAKSAAQAAAAAAEAAQKTADNAATKDALEAVKTTATNAGAVAAQALADAANAQNAANVAQTAAAAAQKAAETAQAAADGATSNAAAALKDAASALATAEAAKAAADDAKTTASAADAAAKEAKATADNALAAAGNATTQAAAALTAAGDAKAAAEAAKYNDEAVRGLIDKAQSAAEAAAKDAKEAAEKAATAVTDAAAAKEAAQKNTDDAIAAATKAINEAKEAIIDAAVAKAVAQVGTVPADQSEAIKDLTKKLEDMGKAQADLATKSGLEEAVKDLQGKIESATLSEEQFAEIAAATGTVKAALSEFLAAITSVELFTWNGDGLGRLNHRNLQFFWAEEVQTWKFGMDLKADDKGVALTNDQMTDHTVDFTEGLVNISKDSVLVRVVPIKAELTPDMICLLNTQGDTISSDFIKVGKPYRLTEKLYTRATDIEVGGLWVIPFEVNKDNFTAEIAASKKKIDLTKRQPYAEKFNTEWSDTEKTDGDYNKAKKYLYAVAVKTHQGDAEAESRRIITQHDLTLMPVMAEHAADYFEVTTKEAVKNATTGKVTIQDKTLAINNIHNRYTYTEQERIYTTKLPEYNYKAVKAAEEKTYNYANWGWFKAYAPRDFKLDQTITSRKGQGIMNYSSGINDDRQWNNLVILDLDIDNEISLDFSAWRTSAGSASTANIEERIKAFYVTLDADFALESKASELQAWSTYEYTNSDNEKTVAIYDVANRPVAKSGKMFEGETGVIVFNVPAEKKKALQGEIIGFRVYAVNFDGTVVNPDGRAFYVQIKKPETPTIKDDEVSVTVKATKEKGDQSDFVEIPSAFLNKFVSGANYSSYRYVSSETPYFANGTDTYSEVKTTYKSGAGTDNEKKYDNATEVSKHQQPYADPFSVTFYKADKKTTTNISDPEVKYLKVTLNAEELVDDLTYSLTYALEDRDRATSAATYEAVGQLKINVKKVIDADASKLPAWFGVKPEAVHDGKVRICLVPSRTNATNADANQKHTNYYGATGPTDFTGTDIANVGWYQVAEVLKGAKATPDDIVLSFNNADAFDTKDVNDQNCKTDKYLDFDNDGKGVSTFYYNTAAPSWRTKAGAWTVADEWSQWGTTENLYVFNDPKAAIEAADKETDATKKAIAYQKIRNSWPKLTSMTVGAYYDNPDGKKISRTIETSTTGSITKQVDTKLYTAAHSVKGKNDNWFTFEYACWHESANFDLMKITTYDQVYSDMTLMYGLKATTKQIALSVKYGDELSEYKYYDGTEATPSATQIPMNGSLKIKDLLGSISYSNPYLTTNTGRSVNAMTKASLDNTIASQAFLMKVSPDVAGNTYPRVVPSKGFSGTNAELAELTYYKYDTANDKLVKQKNVATWVTTLTEYIQYHYVDFFGHDVYVEVPFTIHP